MTSPDLAALRADLMRDEGTGPVERGRLLPYRCPAGKLTLGYGRNIQDVGISVTTATQMLDEDIDAALRDLRTFPWFSRLNGVRQRALVNMRFNLGPQRFRSFKAMIAALDTNNYERAATEMALSRWAEQTGARAGRLVRMMRTGEDR